MEQKINQIKQSFKSDLTDANNSGAFDDLYLKYFSKSHGLVTDLIKELPELSAEDKKKFGPLVNQLQNELKKSIETGRSDYEQKRIEDNRIDMTLPVPPQNAGTLHPATQLIREMNEFFRYYGFSVAEGPEIETDEYNFQRLNLPENHPARDLQDTLYIKAPEILLRTHTSSVESRVLAAQEPPIRVVTPGKVYRNETANRSNSSFFYQYQGVAVDKGITMQNLKATLANLLKYLYGSDVIMRFRYKYYPEVTPGMGVDIQCPFCHGAGCEICKFRGWLEVLGSGMIHPNTLKASGINPKEYTGFAFGMGLDRLVMAKYGINDIRKLYGGGMVYL